MEVINGPLDALHGEKVSVAALLVLEEYKRIAAAITQGRCHAKPYENEDEELLKETFGKKGVLEEIKKENEPELLESISPKHLEECLDGIAEIIDELPNEQDMFHLLEKAGCAKTVYDIGLDEAAVLPSLRLAPYTRRRLSLFCISTQPSPTRDASQKTVKSSPLDGRAKTSAEVNLFLSSSKLSSHWSVHRNF